MQTWASKVIEGNKNPDSKSINVQNSVKTLLKGPNQKPNAFKSLLGKKILLAKKEHLNEDKQPLIISTIRSKILTFA